MSTTPQIYAMFKAVLRGESVAWITPEGSWLISAERLDDSPQGQSVSFIWIDEFAPNITTQLLETLKCPSTPTLAPSADTEQK
jgi:hypothetical protein